MLVLKPSGIFKQQYLINMIILFHTKNYLLQKNSFFKLWLALIHFIMGKVTWFAQDFLGFKIESPMSWEAPQSWANWDGCQHGHRSLKYTCHKYTRYNIKPRIRLSTWLIKFQIHFKRGKIDLIILIREYCVGVQSV